MRSPLRLTLLVAAFALAALAVAPAAFAAPHYVRGPDAEVQGNSLVVSWKAAGLGNTVDTVDFTLTGTVTTTSQCFTRSGNPVQGVPKTDTINVNATGTFDVRNGQTTGSFTITPLTTLECTGNQQARLLNVDFNLFLNGDDLPEVNLTG
jgi:hypothetical protein